MGLRKFLKGETAYQQRAKIRKEELGAKLNPHSVKRNTPEQNKLHAEQIRRNQAEREARSAEKTAKTLDRRAQTKWFAGGRAKAAERAASMHERAAQLRAGDKSQGAADKAKPRPSGGT